MIAHCYLCLGGGSLWVISYKQTRYNLLREQSEGYSKLVAELYQSVGPAHDMSTGEPAETMTRLVQRAQETWARIVALIGYFDLDPNRVVDVFLDCFEAHLTTHWAFFLELLRCSPWSLARPRISSGAEEEVATGGMECDPGSNWDGLSLDEVLAIAAGSSGTTDNSFTPQGRQCGQLLGFKFAYYQVSLACMVLEMLHSVNLVFNGGRTCSTKIVHASCFIVT